MRTMAIAAAFSLSLSCGVATLRAQGGTSQPAESCGLASPTFVTGAPNIFNDRQEQALGDALAEMEEADLRLAPPLADDELTKIGEKLLATLPPTGIQYRFRIYDSGEFNGFSLPGGRVYISRKMIAAAKSEDDLAGVVAHELGHISTHQIAIELTRAWRIRLGVTQVTDRADVFAKVHLFFNTPPNPKEAEDDEEKDQLVADSVALYAMVRAGYAPESFASFLNDTMLNKGKKGNSLTDFLHITGETSKRYRSALKLITSLPESCQQKQPGSSEAFATWQRKMMEERVQSVAEGLTGDAPVTLDPPIRSSLWRIRFSLDGKYVLAQDESGIAVVDRAASKVLFRIDAPEANGAEFTPDSQGVVFDDDSLRVERWDIAKAALASAKELVVFDGCSDVMLAPDGNTLVCVQVQVHADLPRVGIKLIDVESGKPFYDNPAFYAPSTQMQIGGVVALRFEVAFGRAVVSMDFSQGGRYLVVAAGPSVAAWDIEQRREVKLSGRLRGLTQTRMTFLGPDQLYVVGDEDFNGIYNARVLSFPDGRVLKESKIGAQTISGVTKGGLLRTSPMKDYAVGLLDPDQLKFAAASKSLAIDAWGNQLATESTAGGLQLGSLDSNEAKRIPLPLGPMPTPREGVFSPDGKYVAISLKDRAGIWNVETGKQVAFLRPFRTAWFDERDHLLAQFPKFLDREPVVGMDTMSPLSFKELGKLEDGEWQYHNIEYRFEPLGKTKDTDRNCALVVRKMETQAALWSHDYPRETPAVWPAEDNRLVLAWDMSNDTAQAEIKAHPALKAQAEALKDHKKGILIETVDPETGVALEQVVVPEADLTGGSDDVRRARVSGEYVLVRGEHDNSVIYRLDTGARVGEFFGRVMATDAPAKLVAAVNREDEVLLVDEQTGKELKRFALGSPVRLVRIVGSGKEQLLVLTADQVVHRLPLTETAQTAKTR